MNSRIYLTSISLILTLVLISSCNQPETKIVPENVTNAIIQDFIEQSYTNSCKRHEINIDSNDINLSFFNDEYTSDLPIEDRPSMMSVSIPKHTSSYIIGDLNGDGKNDYYVSVFADGLWGGCNCGGGQYIAVLSQKESDTEFEVLYLSFLSHSEVQTEKHNGAIYSRLGDYSFEPYKIENGQLKGVTKKYDNETVDSSICFLELKDSKFIFKPERNGENLSEENKPNIFTRIGAWLDNKSANSDGGNGITDNTSNSSVEKKTNNEYNTKDFNEIQLTLLDATVKKAKIYLGEPDVTQRDFGHLTKGFLIYYNRVSTNSGIPNHLVLFIRLGSPWGDNDKIEEIYSIKENEKACFGIHCLKISNKKIYSNVPDCENCEGN